MACTRAATSNRRIGRPSASIGAPQKRKPGKRQVVVVAREVMGRTLPLIVPRESAALPLIRKHVASGTIVHGHESGAWDALHASYDMRRVNHPKSEVWRGYCQRSAA
jgi:hypothetical protein